MPQMVTHYQFGLDASASLGDVSGTTPETRAAFLLGNQGPDPFFYLLFSPGKMGLAEVGELLHLQRPASVFYAAARYARGLEGKRAAIARSFLAGWACHYALDRSVHPLVYFWQNVIIEADVGLTEDDEFPIHAEIERDFDEAVLYTRMGTTVATMCPSKLTLAAPDSVLEIAGELFAYAAGEALGLELRQELYAEAMRDWRAFCRASWSRTGKKRAVLSKIEEAVSRKYSLLAGQVHRPREAQTSDFANADRRPWKDPYTGEIRTESLEDLANAAFSQVPDLVEALCESEPDPAAIDALTMGVNYGGEYVGEEFLELPERLVPYRLVDNP